MSVDKVLLILSNFVDKKDLDYFVNKKTISYWERSLTHESINIRDNYEKYEFFGDSILEYAFGLFLRENKGITNYGVTNNLLNHYMSKHYQPVIAKKMGLDSLIMISPDVPLTKDIIEDVFEAFFGVFIFISRRLWQKDPINNVSPVRRVVSFFQWYFSKHETLDLTKGDLIDKTFFNEFYFFFTGESTQTKNSWYYNTKNKSFFFNPAFTNQIALYSKDLQKIALSILTKKGFSSESIYLEQITSKFKEMGFDLEWLKYEKAKITFDDTFKLLAKEKGYTRFILRRNEKESYDLLAQKVNPKTRESISETLLSFDSKKDFLSLKKESESYLIDKFR